MASQFLIFFPVHKNFRKNDFTEGIVILLALHHKEACKMFPTVVNKEIRGKIMQYFKEGKEFRKYKVKMTP